MAAAGVEDKLKVLKEKDVKAQEIFDPEEYVLRKRLPRKFPKRLNDVYITKKTNFTAQLTRCRKLLESGTHDAIYVHGLGNAVDRAINIALQLKATSGLSVVTLCANTSTEDLVDDLEPLDEEHEPVVRSRRCSAVHIKISRAAIDVSTKTFNSALEVASRIPAVNNNVDLSLAVNRSKVDNPNKIRARDDPMDVTVQSSTGYKKTKSKNV